MSDRCRSVVGWWFSLETRLQSSCGRSSEGGFEAVKRLQLLLGGGFSGGLENRRGERAEDLEGRACGALAILRREGRRGRGGGDWDEIDIVLGRRSGGHNAEV